MSKRYYLTVCAAAFIVLAGTYAEAQTSRKSVSAAEVNGTFHHDFTGKFKGSASEIKILALGHGKLKVAFDLTYPHVDGTGELSANVGQAEGTADISGDTAVYESREFGTCKITIKFVRPGLIKVSQDGLDTDCGFGNNVTAGGTYKKVSGKRPNFDTEH